MLVADAHETHRTSEVGGTPTPGHLEPQHLAIKIDRAVDIRHLDADMANPAEMDSHGMLLRLGPRFIGRRSDRSNGSQRCCVPVAPTSNSGSGSARVSRPSHMARMLTAAKPVMMAAGTLSPPK